MRYEKLMLIMIPVFLICSCKQGHRVDAVREIPPHQTEPKAVYGSAEKCLKYTSFPFRWDLGERTGDPVDGDTCALGANVLLCHTAEEVNRHNAWVKRILPPVLNEILIDLGVDEDVADRIRPVVEAALNRYLIVPEPS